MTVARAIDADEWGRRIGPDAAGYRRSWRRALRWSAGLVAAVPFLLIWAIAIASRSGSAPAPAGDFFAVTGLVLLGVLVLVAGILSAVGARQTRFRMEGAALRVLRGGTPALSAHDIGSHAKHVNVYDTWAREIGLQGPSEPVAIPEWTPDLLRPMLPGVTARGWFLCAVVASIGVGLGAIVVGITGAIGGATCLASECGSTMLPTMFTVFAIVMGCGAVAAVFGTISVIRINAEYRHGYVTTVATGSRSGRIFDYRTGADLVDPKTGYVLRPACDAPIDAATYPQRLQAIRRAHPNARPQRLPCRRLALALHECQSPS